MTRRHTGKSSTRSPSSVAGALPVATTASAVRRQVGAAGAPAPARRQQPLSAGACAGASAACPTENSDTRRQKNPKSAFDGRSVGARVPRAPRPRHPLHGTSPTAASRMGLRAEALAPIAPRPTSEVREDRRSAGRKKAKADARGALPATALAPPNAPAHFRPPRCLCLDARETPPPRPRLRPGAQS